MQLQAALEDAVLDTVLTNAFDATSDKLDAVRKPLQASLRSTSIQAAGLDSTSPIHHSPPIFPRPYR